MKTLFTWIVILFLTGCSLDTESEKVRESSINNYVSDFVTIPAGSFIMGDLNNKGVDGEKPVHEVTIKSFMLSTTEVTVGQFKQFIDDTGYITEAEQFKPNSSVKRGCGQTNHVKGTSWRNPGFEQTDNHPVTCVTYNDAVNYIDWLNDKTGEKFRLPSESEWEYAARGGSSSIYGYGNNKGRLCHYANIRDRTWYLPGHIIDNVECDDGVGYKTATVKSYAPNQYGLYDMIGNLYEFTQDCVHSNYKNAPNDGTAWMTGNRCDYVMVRGGFWGSKASGARLANRGRISKNTIKSSFGFRLALDDL